MIYATFITALSVYYPSYQFLFRLASSILLTALIRRREGQTIVISWQIPIDPDRTRPGFGGESFWTIHRPSNIGEDLKSSDTRRKKNSNLLLFCKKLWLVYALLCGISYQTKQTETRVSISNALKIVFLNL